MDPKAETNDDYKRTSVSNRRAALLILVIDF